MMYKAKSQKQPAHDSTGGDYGGEQRNQGYYNKRGGYGDHNEGGGKPHRGGYKGNKQKNYDE